MKTWVIANLSVKFEALALAMAEFVPLAVLIAFCVLVFRALCLIRGTTNRLSMVEFTAYALIGTFMGFAQSLNKTSFAGLLPSIVIILGLGINVYLKISEKYSGAFDTKKSLVGIAISSVMFIIVLRYYTLLVD